MLIMFIWLLALQDSHPLLLRPPRGVVTLLLCQALCSALGRRSHTSRGFAHDDAHERFFDDHYVIRRNFPVLVESQSVHLVFGQSAGTARPIPTGAAGGSSAAPAVGTSTNSAPYSRREVRHPCSRLAYPYSCHRVESGRATAAFAAHGSSLRTAVCALTPPTASGRQGSETAASGNVNTPV